MSNYVSIREPLLPDALLRAVSETPATALAVYQAYTKAYVAYVNSAKGSGDVVRPNVEKVNVSSDYATLFKVNDRVRLVKQLGANPGVDDLLRVPACDYVSHDSVCDYSVMYKRGACRIYRQSGGNLPLRMKGALRTSRPFPEGSMGSYMSTLSLGTRVGSSDPGRAAWGKLANGAVAVSDRFADGECYMAIIKLGQWDKARGVLGSSPTVNSILRSDASMYDFSLNTRFDETRTGSYHVQEYGGMVTGSSASMFQLRCSANRCRPWPAGSLGNELVSSVVSTLGALVLDYAVGSVAVGMEVGSVVSAVGHGISAVIACSGSMSVVATQLDVTTLAKGTAIVFMSEYHRHRFLVECGAFVTSNGINAILVQNVQGIMWDHVVVICPYGDKQRAMLDDEGHCYTLFTRHRLTLTYVGGAYDNMYSRAIHTGGVSVFVESYARRLAGGVVESVCGI